MSEDQPAAPDASAAGPEEQAAKQRLGCGDPGRCAGVGRLARKSSPAVPARRWVTRPDTASLSAVSRPATDREHSQLPWRRAPQQVAFALLFAARGRFGTRVSP